MFASVCSTRLPARALVAASFLWFLFASPAPAQENDASLQANKARAIAVARDGQYEQRFTQHAPDGAPDPRLFSQWILDEINNDSAMRDQIADELVDIQENGHNAPRLTFYYTRDKQWIGRLLFKPADLEIKRGGGKDGLYRYEAVLKARNAGNHADSVPEIKVFRFTFKVKSEYFRFTKAYQVTVVSYPLYSEKAGTGEH